MVAVALLSSEDCAFRVPPPVNWRLPSALLRWLEGRPWQKSVLTCRPLPLPAVLEQGCHVPAFSMCMGSGWLAKLAKSMLFWVAGGKKSFLKQHIQYYSSWTLPWGKDVLKLTWLLESGKPCFHLEDSIFNNDFDAVQETPLRLI